MLIIGAITPSAPMSSARDTEAKSEKGVRTIGAAPPALMAPMAVTAAAKSHSPCCMSTLTAAKPSRAIVSAMIGEPSADQPQ